MKQLSYFSLYIISFFIVMPLRSALNWENWAKNQKCAPTKIWYPGTLEEVRTIILNAAKQKLSIRFVGSGHSYSGLVCTPGYIVNTDKFNKIIAIDKSKCTAKVEGGIKLKDLFKHLARAGLALSNQGYIAEQSIAGATATCTHGSGHTGGLSDFVIGVELMDAHGVLHAINETNNADWLPAARVHLGALGFVYSMTLQCEPLFVLEHKQFLMKWDDIIRDYDDLYERNDYVMTMGPASQDITLVYTWNRTAKPVTGNFCTKLLENLIMSNMVNKLGADIARVLPFITSAAMNISFRFLEQKAHREYSYKTLSPLENPISVCQYIEEEHAIPYECFGEAVKAVRDLYLAYEKRGSACVAIIACRFSPAFYTSCLGQNYGRKTAYITINGINGAADYAFYQDFDQLMLQYTGRPHWGKLNYLTKDRIRTLWGDNAQKYNQVRKVLDPENIFANDFIKRCFD